MNSNKLICFLAKFINISFINNNIVIFFSLQLKLLVNLKRISQKKAPKQHFQQKFKNSTIRRLLKNYPTENIKFKANS